MMSLAILAWGMLSVLSSLVPQRAQGTLLSDYTLHRTHDSLYYLNEWRLPYPVYQFCTGDVDGDGSEDALVGVIKTTRYYKDRGRRLFIFKHVNGKVRPLWLGSKLAGQLQDFRYINGGIVRSLESWPDGRYSVAEWRWKDFGLSFQRYLVHQTDQSNAISIFSDHFTAQ
jgi:hypothetical protein